MYINCLYTSLEHLLVNKLETTLSLESKDFSINKRRAHGDPCYVAF